MNWVIRPGTEADVPEMLRLWREMMDFHARVEPRFRPLPQPEGEGAWEKYLREDILGNSAWCVFVADADGSLVGHIMGTVRDRVPVFEPERYGYVTDIVVDPEARRSGIGRALFAALQDWFQAHGVSVLELQVAHHNPASQAFWRAMGCTDYMDVMWFDLEAS